MDGKAIDATIACGVTAADILDHMAKRIAKVALAKHADGIPVDMLTIHNETGLEWEKLEALIDLIPTVAHAEYYADVIKNYATVDTFTHLATWIAKKISKTSVDEVDAAVAEIGAAVDTAMQSGRLLNTGSLSDAATTWLDRMTAPDDNHTLLNWPVAAITHNMGRVDRELIWIVARESVGKTAFIIQWLLVLASYGHTVSLASLESSRESIGSRAIANNGMLDNFHIRQRRATRELIDKAYNSAKTLPDSIRIIDNSMTLDQLYAWGKSEARRGSRLIIVDNTRHIIVRGNVDRVNEVAEISQRMKQLRDETQIPVVVLHHSTYDKKTGAEDVSWSKDIRRDADVIVFLKADEELSRPPMDTRDAGLWAVRFCVEKNRESRAGYDILIRFKKEWQAFIEWCDDDEEYARR